MGGPAAGDARPSGGGATQPADEQLVDDIGRIAGSVREVVGAVAAIVSRVVDDEWLEVMAVSGDPSAGIVEGLRWQRDDLDSLLGGAETRGRLHATKHRTVSYVEVPTNTPETERYIAHHQGLLLAPLYAPAGDLVGVLSTEGPVDLAHPPPGACELVELYADQARLVLTALRHQDVLTERLRMSYAAQAVLHGAAAADGVPSLLDSVAARLGEMMRARGAWACAELEPGVLREAASYPTELADRLGAEVCTLLEPMIARCLEDGTTQTHESDRLLGRLAAVAGYEQALLAALGDGVASRGALLVFRAADDDPWSEADREAFFMLGRRLGTLTAQAKGRRRDQVAAEELLRLDAYRRDLVASITHDLKTPLTAIALNTELLESDGRLAEAGSHPVTAIRRSADRLANLVDDLLAMARAEEGVDPVAEVDLVTMLRDACGHAETEAQLRGVVFDLHAPEELRATVDQNALARVFANLVANAVKFSLPRGRVVLHLSRTDDGVEFRCTDEGVGIPPERLASLFDIPRRPPDSRSEDFPGSGIGLAICQRIVTRMGGRISADSTQGQGSTFTVILPADPAEVHAVQR